MVIVNVLVPPAAIGFGLNDLVVVGGASTVKIPVAAVPLPALPVVMALVVLVYVPPVGAVTSTLITQSTPDATVPAVVLPKLSVVLPARGVKLPGPQPVVLALGVAATAICPPPLPVGSGSLNVTPVMVLPFGL